MENSPLKTIVFRIDFNPPFRTFNQGGLSQDVLLIIKEEFPLIEPQQNIATEFRISPQGFNKQESTKNQITFFSPDRLNRLVVNEDSIIFSYNRYVHFSHLETTWGKIIKALYDRHQSELNANRIGLRYVNQIEKGSEDVFNWDKIIKPEMSCMFNIFEQKSNFLRSIGLSEIKIEEGILRMQYGMHNPDYPALIAKKIFLLDFDASFNGIMDRDDILRKIPYFHSEIKKAFINSITTEYKEAIYG